SEARLVTELETARHRARGGGETFRHTPLVQCYHRHSAIAAQAICSRAASLWPPSQATVLIVLQS
ncbi:MAG: hypothetical protein RSC11_08265, partial [Mucinivorans sp.]